MKFWRKADKSDSDANSGALGSWLDDPAYRAVRFMDEADGRKGVFVFVNTRLVEEQANAAADAQAADETEAVVASGLDPVDQIALAAQAPDGDRVDAEVQAAINNPANWVREDNDSTAQPDDQYVCMELDPLTGRVLVPDE